MLLVQVHSCVLTRSKHAAAVATAAAAAAVAAGQWRRRRHQRIQLQRFHDVVILFQDFFFCPIFGPLLEVPLWDMAPVLYSVGL